MPWTICEERPEDARAIRDLLVAAFQGDAEALLVERLRAEGAVIASLVAVENGIVGHVMFSRLVVEGSALRAAALAPLAVHPELQRRGIGSALVRAGLEACRAQDSEAVFVVGDPDYYRRFGFTPPAAQPFPSPYDGPAFQALALCRGALAAGGTLRYPEAFAGLA